MASSQSRWGFVRMLPYLANLKSMILTEVTHIQGFMGLLMKQRNGSCWSKEDKASLRIHLRHLAHSIPSLGIFILPGGWFLLPLLAFFLDRRNRKNRPALLRGEHIAT
jgi:hypothetical protein